MALCLFVGVDQHRHSRLVGQALISDETTSLYIWVLKNLLVATNNLQPTTIYSDCDTELGLAIEITLSTTRYLYCIFYIVQNIKKHLMHLLGSEFTAFQNDFFICHNTLFEEIFES
ncbi:20169_t:CDS:1 [Gigaspora rosea]|nr:20169_t:CDS:1 [Gigaspora rosea]